MNNQRSFFFNVDWYTVLIYLALVIIGLFNIHAAVYDEAHSSIFDLDVNYGKQALFIVASIIIASIILLMDSKFFNSFAPIAYIGTLLLLIVVLLIGRSVGGNKAWIPIGSFRLQPAEFAKFATSLVLAKYLGGVNLKLTDLKPQLAVAVIIGLPMLLILLQPDAGSTLVFISLILVLYREGLSQNFLIIGVILIILFLVTLLVEKLYIIISLVLILSFLIYQFKRKRQMIITFIAGFVISVAFVFCTDFIYHSVLQKHQTSRIDDILGITNDTKGVGYNVNQSKIAIGSGGLFGRGYLQGTQTKYDFVPEQSTDFIFCTIGEEWGFIGAFTVIGLYLFLLMRIIFLAERQRSSFSRVYGYCVACIIFCHFFINIGMTVGLVPVIGIPLPFISYGGSSLVSFTILLFILIKLDSNRMGII